MAITLNFSDRFSYPAPNGVSPDIDFEAAQALSDEQLESYSKDLKEMANMVRAYSVIINRKRTLEIFNIITQQADPKISLILAAARSKTDNSYVFGGLAAVKEVMFNDSSRSGGTGFTNRSAFSDGIRRVCVAFTVSILLGQLAQVPEQLEHAKYVEQQAIADLDRVVATYELSQTTSDSKGKIASEQAPIAFYFEPKQFGLPSTQELVLEWYSPTLLETWETVRRYRGNIDTWNVVTDLADSINSAGISNTDSHLLAVAELSGPRLTSLTIPVPTSFHALRFFPRRPSPGSIAHSINVRIERRPIDEPSRVSLAENHQNTEIVTDPALFNFSTTPFLWGPNSGSLSNYCVNGSILITSFNKISNLNQEKEGFSPVCIYFRNKWIYTSDLSSAVPPENAKIRFRIQPNLAQELSTEDIREVEIDFPRKRSDDSSKQLELDNYRFSEVAVAILNALSYQSLEARATGAIIRNDPYSSNDACSCIELTAWPVSKYVAYVIIDILEIPEDIEMAVGNREEPQNYYSNNPKSIKVECVTSSVSDGTSASARDRAYVIERKKSRLWKSILDENAGVETPISWF